ncbi:MAG: hypothetical protein AB7O57_16315 [Hyphomicrobiaceae bacterium]
MSVALRRPNRATEQEYLEFESTLPLRHELVGGETYAMVGGTDRRNPICTNLVAALHSGSAVELTMPVTKIYRDIPF